MHTTTISWKHIDIHIVLKILATNDINHFQVNNGNLSTSVAYGAIHADKDKSNVTQIKVYWYRWYIVLVFSLYGLMQGAIWNTWGPISKSALCAFNFSSGKPSFKFVIKPGCYTNNSRWNWFLNELGTYNIHGINAIFCLDFGQQRT